jgi:hypothetical protein
MYHLQASLNLLLLATAAATGSPVTFAVEEGFEHPNAHHHGFVLDSVFTHHATATATTIASSEKKKTSRRLDDVQHFVTQRKLKFNQHRRLLSAWSPASAFDVDHMNKSFNALDTTAVLTRDKVRALAKFIFLNAAGAQDWDVYSDWGTAMDIPAAAGDLWYTNKTDKSSAVADMNKMVMTFLNATIKESNAVADANDAVIQEYDVPNREKGRAKIGLVALLWKKGKERILWWRDTISPGDNINIESWMTSAFVRNFSSFCSILFTHFDRPLALNTVFDIVYFSLNIFRLTIPTE